jgi:hypothetical protein
MFINNNVNKCVIYLFEVNLLNNFSFPNNICSGFKYDFVHSYGEGLACLQKPCINNPQRSPYTQMWLFCSPGYGNLPDIAEDKNVLKIIPFLQAVRDFWLFGGGLFIFFDNKRFNFE